MLHGLFLFVLPIFLSSLASASGPGLPLTEDFAETSLRDATRTSANWSAREEALLMNSRSPLYGAFGPGLMGADITGEMHDTRSLALGDMDGDGDLDLVEGNSDEACRLYFNDGLVFKGTLPSGLAMTGDARDTRSVAVGDLDGDGDLDLVTGNFNHTNRLYLNNGTLNPFPATLGSDITADADDTASVALGDLDGDGDLDLIAGNNGTQNRLYLNNGTADPFAGVAGLAITTDASATNSVALGDLDSDGDLDLVVANFQQPSAVYLNNGTDDPFAGVTGAEYAPNSSDIEPSVALGDMNGDGHLDIVRVGGELAEFDQIYFNNGTANPFEGVPGLPINVDEDLSFSVALGDVDCDGDLDVITGNTGLFSEGGKNRLYLNNGTSQPFLSAVGTNLSEDIHHSVALALGDIDEDGDLDAIAGNRNQRNRLYRNGGTANPFEAIGGSDIDSDSMGSFSLALGDLDRDGDLDLIASKSASTNRLHLNNGTSDPFMGVLETEVATDASSTLSVALGDVDCDGDLDLVTGNALERNRLYLNNGTLAPFAGVVGKDIGLEKEFTVTVALSDMDSDGDLDLLAANLSIGFPQNHRLYLNNGTADPFEGVEGIEIPSGGTNTQFMTVGDIDGDADQDFITANLDVGSLLYFNNGTADPFSGVTATAITTESTNTRCVALGDLDRDGDLDLLAGNLQGQPSRLYLNNGTSDPFEGVEGIVFADLDTSLVSLATGDLDGDGDIDVVAGNNGGPNRLNRLYLNNGTSNPLEGAIGRQIASEAEDTFSVVLGDMDGDGDRDILSGSFGVLDRLYLNGSNSGPLVVLTENDVSPDERNTRSLAVGDVDGDGDRDVVAGNAGEPNRLYLSNGKLDPFEGVTGSDITSDSRQTSSVALADLDNDGDLDLVAGNSGETNRYYPNLGGPDPFAGAIGTDISSDSNSTTSVALGDIDRDGDEDLVAGNFGQTNRLYFNNGTPEPWREVVVVDITQDAHNTTSVALADIDRDGFLDLVAGNAGQANRLYLNQMSAGPFSAQREIDPATGVTVSMAVGDVDGDGDKDVIVARGSLVPPPSVPAKLYLNNGDGDPFAGSSITNITPLDGRIFSLALGDLDGDQDLDLVTTALSEPMRYYPNNGTSAPFDGVAPVDITSELHTAENAPLAVALGDMDGDDDLDIVLSLSSLPLRLYLNNGTPAPFEGVAGIDIGSGTSITVSLSLADFDGDEDLDIASGNAFLNDRSRLYLNNGTANPFGGVVGSDIGPETASTTSLAAADFNGDGRLDIAAAKGSRPSLLYVNNGTANPFEGVSGVVINSTTITTVAQLASGDVDGDEDIDLVLGVTGVTQRSQLFLNNGGANPFEGAVGIEIGSSIARTVRLALDDMDGDGDLDLVVGNNFIPDEVLLNNQMGNPFLSGVDITPDAHNTNSVALADVDVDGDLDLIAGNFNQPNRLYLNNGTEDPFFDAIGIEAGVGVRNTEEVAFADIDRNGRPDLLTANLGQPNQVFLNIDNQFALPFVGIDGIDISQDSDNTRSILAADMDRDGYPDLIAGNDGQVNRLYTQHRFKTGPSVATSLTVDTKPDDIHRILLEVEETLPPNTSIDYFISADGGQRWSQVQPSRTFPLPMLGSDLRWRAVLKSLSPRFSPHLNTLLLDLGPGLKTDPASVNFGDRLPNTGPSAPVTVTIVNEDAVTLTISSVLLGGVHAGEFVFSNDTGEINLQPGGMRAFDVAFNPTSLGEKIATVSIASDDIDRPNVEVGLRGVGGANPTATPSPASTPTVSFTPTPEGTSYDIRPNPPDGQVDARDLLGWLGALRDSNSDRTLLFDFARFWKTSVD
jgi:hypothetical protein